MILKFYEVSDEPGGEDIWLRRIAKLYSTTPTLIWSKKGIIELEAKSIFNKLLLGFSLRLDKFLPGIGRGVFLNLLFYFYKLEDNMPVFLSSTYIPIPRGECIVTYIHTPARALTVDYRHTLSMFEKSPIKRLFLRIFRTFYKATYSVSLYHPKVRITNSENIKSRVLDFAHKSSIVMYPTQDVSNFYNNKAENYFLLVSRIQRYKGQDFCLRAFNIFQEKRKDYTLILAATSPRSDDDKKFYNEILEYIKKNNLNVRIYLDLPREKIVELYSKTYLCLFGSKEEDLGQIPIESMSASKPIISVMGNGPSETIINGETGFLVNTEKEMSEKMHFLVENPCLSTEMGMKGRNRAYTIFNDPVFKEGLDKVLSTLDCATRNQ